MFLRELVHSVATLAGVGPATAGAFARLGVGTVSDLLSFLPRDYRDRATVLSLERLTAEEESAESTVNTVVEVVAHLHIGRSRTLKVVVEERQGQSSQGARAALWCFGRPFLAKRLAPGQRFFLYGTFARRKGELWSSNFEIEPWRADAQRTPLAVYPLTEGLRQHHVRRAVADALAGYGDRLDDELPAALLARRRLGGSSHSLRALHLPTTLEEARSARRSLAFTELFYLQLVVARRAVARSRRTRLAPSPAGALRRQLVDRLPFRLTDDQEQALAEIADDLSGDRPMSRLLQGEVGSGKTLVAFLAILDVVERGCQAAVLAPTELLARQHAESAARLLAPLGVRLAYLSGNVRERGRAELLERLAAGEIDVAVGTHALFAAPVSFRRLQLVVVDEQHRFGVAQRIALVEKGDQPDVLLMTATPIPRTLALTVFGDLAVSTLRRLPPGRKPVETHLAKVSNAEKVYAWVKRQLQGGRQAYFVYPSIEASVAAELKNAESMYARLAGGVFREFRVGLIHSRLADEEKSGAMSAFARNEIDVLVATSVVEVGVDVPNATVMVVEHAERFGMSALHQLRGRVGRGTEQGYAFFVYGETLSPEGRERLKVLKRTNDGFAIAEEDLRIRGPGELAGARQSGYFRFRFADLIGDADLLAEARDDAFALVRDDPGLLAPDHAVVRAVLERVPPFSGETLEG